MKKTRKWSSILMAAITVLSFSACEDWGQMDPPAGTDVYPKLEQVANVTFEDDAFDPESLNYYAYQSGDIAVVESDKDHGKVLHLPDGYARMFNPLNNVKVQNGVSLTFWVKQALLTDEETNEELENDVEGALFSFQNSNGTQRMYLTANGELKYEGVDGEYVANAASQTKTGMLRPAGEWHYVAVTVRNNGYSIYVDGLQRIEKEETDFDFSKIVQFMANTPYIYIGYGADTATKEMWIDDLNIYRNQITGTQQAMPGTSGGSSFTYPVATKTTIGTSDCTTVWWTEFSDYYTLQPGTTLHLAFTNHTSGAGNWNNWNLGVTTEAERGGDGYAEYFVLRSDLYGWGDSNYNAANMGNEGYGDWDKFRVDMEGAYVTIDISRSGSKVQVIATATCSDGTVYKETYWQECGDGTQNINAFLIVDNSYLVMDTKNTSYLDAISITQTTVGTPDCSAAWWTSFSEYFTIQPKSSFEIEFTNHTSGAGNWNNWNLGVTTEAERGGDGYAEYFVLRSDLYGWGDSNYNAANLGNEGYGDWDKFRIDMEGANVTIHISRSADQVHVTATATCSDGTVYTETYWQKCGDGTQNINAFLIVDSSYLELKEANKVTYAFQ